MTVALPLLGEISIVLIVLWGIALGLGAYLFQKLLLTPIANTIRHVWVIGNPLADLIEGIGNILYKISKALVGGGDKIIGTMFHLMAEQLNWFWDQVKKYSILFGIISASLLLIHRAVIALEHAASGAHINLKGINDEIKKIEKRFKGIEHGLKDLSELLLAFGGIDALVHLLKHLIGLRQWVT